MFQGTGMPVILTSGMVTSPSAGICILEEMRCWHCSHPGMGLRDPAAAQGAVAISVHDRPASTCTCTCRHLSSWPHCRQQGTTRVRVADDWDAVATDDESACAGCIHHIRWTAPYFYSELCDRNFPGCMWCETLVRP